MFADIHGGSNLQYRCIFLFAGVYRSCQLRIAEHIHHPVIADPVAASEIFMRIVIEHTPAKASGDIRLSGYGIQDIGMPDCMFTAVFFVIECFGRIHMSVILTDQIGLFLIGSYLCFRFTAGHFSIVKEVIIGVDIFQQMTFLDSPDTACLSCRVQFVNYSIGFFIKYIVIRRFIDPYTPQNNGRMIAVLEDHIFRVLHRLRLPGIVTDMLPAGEFREHQQSKLITAVQKIMALRIM